MPTEAPIDTAEPLIVYGRDRLPMMPWASFDSSSFEEVDGSTTSNSSPPRRPTCPRSPTSSVRRSATSRSSVSPAGRPSPPEPQQRVAGGVAERVVDRLEPVEIEQKDRAAVLAPDRSDQRVVE